MDIFSHIYLYLMNSKVNKISNIKIYESHYTVQEVFPPIILMYYYYYY